MDAQQFALWLQGYVEMGGGPPNEQQWQMVKEHLALVFKKVAPTKIEYKPKSQQELEDEFKKTIEEKLTKRNPATNAEPTIWPTPNKIVPMAPSYPSVQPWQWPTPDTNPDFDRFSRIVC